MESDIRLAGYSSERVDVCFQSNGYMTGQLFECWDDQMFFPYGAQARRALADYQGPAILILNGFNVHHTVAFISEVVDQNISPSFLVPHSRGQCQPLDLVTYESMKRFMPTAQIRYLLSNQSQKIVKMPGVWHQATAPDLVVSGFTAMELVPFIGGNGLVHMRLDRQRATQIRSWPGQDRHPMDIGDGGNRRIRVPTQ
jgi:hypothetical protein